MRPFGYMAASSGQLSTISSDGANSEAREQEESIGIETNNIIN